MFTEQLPIIGSDHGFTPNRKQAIIRIHDSLLYWRMYASLHIGNVKNIILPTTYFVELTSVFYLYI